MTFSCLPQDIFPGSQHPSQKLPGEGSRGAGHFFRSAKRHYFAAAVAAFKIAELDTLKTSKQLKNRVEQGLLVNDPARSKRNTVCRKPASDNEAPAPDLLSSGLDNNPSK